MGGVSMTFIPIDTNSKVDPRYYYQQQLSSQESSHVGVSHSTEDLINVSATVNDLNQWKQDGRVTTKSVIQSGTKWLVTATIKRSIFESLATKSYVDNIQIAKDFKSFPRK